MFNIFLCFNTLIFVTELNKKQLESAIIRPLAKCHSSFFYATLQVHQIRVLPALLPFNDTALQRRKKPPQRRNLKRGRYDVDARMVSVCDGPVCVACTEIASCSDCSVSRSYSNHQSLADCNYKRIRHIAKTGMNFGAQTSTSRESPFSPRLVCVSDSGHR